VEAGKIRPAEAVGNRIVRVTKGGTLLRIYPDGKTKEIVFKTGDVKWFDETNGSTDPLRPSLPSSPERLLAREKPASIRTAHSSSKMFWHRKASRRGSVEAELSPLASSCADHQRD